MIIQHGASANKPFQQRLIVAQVAILAVGPSVLAMCVIVGARPPSWHSMGVLRRIVGAIVCKASNLPHIPWTTAAELGAIGGVFAEMVCIPFIFVVMVSSISLNKRYREQGIRSGRLPRNCRQSGHFLDILLFVPVIFLNCLLGGLIGRDISSIKPGYYVYRREATASQGVSRREVAQMGAIGGLIVAPIFPIVFFFLCGVIEVAWTPVSEISQGYPSSSSLVILPYLWRQFGAFGRLLQHITGCYRAPSPPMAAV